jgi:hypothetical protein
MAINLQKGQRKYNAPKFTVGLDGISIILLQEPLSI